MADERAVLTFDVSSGQGRRELLDWAHAAEQAERASSGAIESVNAMDQALSTMSTAAIMEAYRGLAEGLRQLAGAAREVLASIDTTIQGMAEGEKATQRWASALQITGDAADNLAKVGEWVGGRFTDMKAIGMIVQEVYDRAKEAAAGNAQYAQTFRDLGVAITGPSGELKTAGALFMEVSDRIATMGDSSQAMALSGELLGARARDWAAALREDGRGLTALMADMDRFGHFTDEQWADLRRYLLATKELQYAEEALARELTIATAPAMGELKSRLAEMVRETARAHPQVAALIALARGSSPALRDAGMGILQIATNLHLLGIRTGGLLAVLRGGGLLALLAALGAASMAWAAHIDRSTQAVARAAGMSQAWATTLRQLATGPLNILLGRMMGLNAHMAIQLDLVGRLLSGWRAYQAQASAEGLWSRTAGSLRQAHTMMSQAASFGKSFPPVTFAPISPEAAVTGAGGGAAPGPSVEERALDRIAAEERYLQAAIADAQQREAWAQADQLRASLAEKLVERASVTAAGSDDAVAAIERATALRQIAIDAEARARDARDRQRQAAEERQAATLGAAAEGVELARIQIDLAETETARAAATDRLAQSLRGLQDAQARYNDQVGVARTQLELLRLEEQKRERSLSQEVLFAGPGASSVTDYLRRQGYGVDISTFNGGQSILEGAMAGAFGQPAQREMNQQLVDRTAEAFANALIEIIRAIARATGVGTL